MKLDAKRWIILVAGIVACIFQGTAYASSVFAKPLTEFLGTTGGTFAMAFALTIGLMPISMIVGGMVANSSKVRLGVIIGVLLYGLGIFACGLVKSWPAFYFTFGLMMSFGGGLAYAAVMAIVLRWFPDKRGLASGLFVASISAGTIFIAPVAQAIIASQGVRNMFLILGGVSTIVMVLASLILANPPEGYKPEGFVPVKKAEVSGKDYTPLGMLGTVRFWALFLVYACGAFGGLMVTSQLSKIATEMTHITPAVAALFVSVLAISNTCGRFLWGWVSDKIGRMMSLTLMFAITAAAMFALPTFALVQTKLLVAVIAVGLCYGGYLGTFPSLTADSFGAKFIGINYALMFAGVSVASLFGPNIAASVFTNTGSYEKAFVIGGFATLAGLVLCVIVMLSDRAKAAKPAQE
ncbi:MAG: OFA family MFS transporter [Abditibacteriota bacterium]|nr:OFA family MFS transporter [Abditibacteriota bacterium]